MLNSRILIVLAVLSASLVQSFCSKAQAVQPAKSASESKKQPKPEETKAKARPKISFEKTVHDFGEVGPRTKNTCEFKFTNVSQALLKIGKINAPCGCTVFSVDKKEYAPGDTGIIKVTYSVGKSTGPSEKYIYVPSNDKKNPNVKLTVKATVVKYVEATPKKFELSLRKQNAGIPDITLKSRDGKPFSIKGFKSTNNSVVADFDPNISVPEFVLHPKVDIEKVKTQLKGYIEIHLTHPKCRSARIFYTVLPEFKATPGSIRIFDAKPQKALTREITVTSNYGEDFEVESTSSKSGYIKVLSQKKFEKTYKFSVQVTPPSIEKQRFFSDTLYVNIKGKDKLSISCLGYYSRAATCSAKPGKGSLEFKAEPSVVKVRNAEPGRPLIREVQVFKNNDEDFEIESTSSKKGTIKLLSQQKLGHRYKLKLHITPPPTKHRLKIFSDVFYVNIKSNKNKKETVKLPITCRGSYSRKSKKH